MTSSPLSDLTLTQVSDRLSEYGSSLKGEAREAIHKMLHALESGLTGTLEDAYHLSPIDTGLGKSLSVATFLRCWKAQGFTPASSVLIGLSRLKEIPSYLTASGLLREDVAVLTSDRELNALGVPEGQHGDAPVMFTSQQMIERRTRGRLFAEASEFHFHGQPRSLRIWDESLIPAEPLVLRVDELAGLPSALRHHSPELTDRIVRFLTDVWRRKDGVCAEVPGDFANLIEASSKPTDQRTGAALETLGRLSGSTVHMLDAGQGDMHMAGSSPPLPADFAPVVILDASGRVRETYRIWETTTGNLRRLPTAVKDYSNLSINLWEHAVGQEAMRRAGTKEGVAQAIADAIDQQESEEDWLVIHYKDHPIEDQLRHAVQRDMDGKLHFLHWGDHHGTNAYEHCRNVVLIGQLTYGAASYPAYAIASGAQAPLRPDKVFRAIKSGEYRHNLLQALTRASVRHSDGGLAGSCRAFIIASPGTEARELLSDTFPRCTIETWRPRRADVGGKAGALIAILEDAARQRDGRRIPKKELDHALSVDRPNRAALLKHPAVVDCMERLGVRVEHSNIVMPARFDPYPGGGFSSDGLDDPT